ARVSPEAVAGLDPDALYGLWTFNRLHTRTHYVSEPPENGRRYRRKVLTRARPEEEHIHVPVPYAGIPLEVVKAARAAIKNNRRPSKAGLRFWQLSGGILRCAVCGMGMQTGSVKARSGDRYHHYYSCRARHRHGDAVCTHKRHHRADELEGVVWEVVSGLLNDPERLQEGLDEMVEAERAEMRGDPEQQAKAWLEKLAAVDGKRSRFQDMAAEGHITFSELGAKLRELDKTREIAAGELERLRGRRKALEDLERDRDAIMETYAGMVPEALDELTGEERHQLYRMLRLKVYVGQKGDLDIRGAIRAPESTPPGGAAVCTSEGTR
ncbi:MAG: zinc ribbon domain-containing protein, partial [Rubrobacteraceae bacterium]